MGREAAKLTQQKHDADLIGLVWPQPIKKGAGRASRQALFEMAMYNHIRAGTFPSALVSRDVPDWWSRGEPLIRSAEHVAAGICSAAVVEKVNPAGEPAVEPAVEPAMAPAVAPAVEPAVELAVMISRAFLYRWMLSAWICRQLGFTHLCALGS